MERVAIFYFKFFLSCWITRYIRDDLLQRPTEYENESASMYTTRTRNYCVLYSSIIFVNIRCCNFVLIIIFYLRNLVGTSHVNIIDFGIGLATYTFSMLCQTHYFITSILEFYHVEVIKTMDKWTRLITQRVRMSCEWYWTIDGWRM